MQVHAFGTTEVPPFSFCWRDGGRQVGRSGDCIGWSALISPHRPTTDHRGVKTCLQQRYMCA
jgi:hypothetical protein